MVRQFFQIPTTSFFSLVLANINNLNLTISKCCCGPRKSPKYVLRHPCSDPWVAHFCHTSLLIFTFRNCAISLRPLLSSKSSKHLCNYKHSRTVCFSSWSPNISFSSKTQLIISILGLFDFWLDRLIFRILIFPEEIFKFWSDHGFDAFTSFS